MGLFNISLNPWYILIFRINWLLLVIIMAIILIFILVFNKTGIPFRHWCINIDEITLGIGSNVIKLKYNSKDREIAYKLWIEMNTRKVGIEFDEEDDVITEVYDSWYAFFGIARDLIKEIPVNQFERTEKLIQITLDVLNKGLRPTLTKWQAKYRKWYSEAIKNKENIGLSPQEIQRKYPQYIEIVNDIKSTNAYMIELKKLMHKIAFTK